MSVQESKKKSSSLSSKRSKEEHQDEKDADEIPVEAVIIRKSYFFKKNLSA